MHLSVLMQFYYAANRDMFRPIKWPSSGSWEQEYIYHHNVNVHFSMIILLLLSPPGRWPHDWPKHVAVYYVIKFYLYTQVHLLACLKQFTRLELHFELGQRKRAEWWQILYYWDTSPGRIVAIVTALLIGVQFPAGIRDFVSSKISRPVRGPT